MPDIVSTVASQNAWTNKVNQALAPLNVTLPQALLLILIADKKTVTCGETANALNVSRGNMTGIVERVQNAGLISTARGKPDKRKVHLTLTDAGADLIPQIKDVFAKVEVPAA
jgi:DNA-binding MarR family transcriptional regulator